MCAVGVSQPHAAQAQGVDSTFAQFLPPGTRQLPAAKSLEAERKVALKLTENEKRAAKHRFEGKLRRELFGAGI
ncbi:MAG: hypothetical protein ACC726_01085 [Chloroflexota bacterium]